MAGHSNTDLPPKSFDECMAPGLDPGREECNAIMWWNKGDILRGESGVRSYCRFRTEAPELFVNLV
jgi:hypothetical protein